jgi:CRP/FNR family cyclic AMP-dependent transcriptional regulator
LRSSGGESGIEIEFLSRLGSPERTALFDRGRPRQLPRGAYLITEGNRSDAVFVLLSGHVKVFSTTARGDEVILAVRGPGALLGELAAIDDGPRTASVCALEPLEVLAVPKEAFGRYLEAYPTVALMLLRTITGRLRDADRKRVEFGAHDAVSRVALRLLELADRFGEPTPAGIRIMFPFTQDELAGWVGTSREAVVKALRTLRQLGYVQTQRRGAVICDADGLRGRAGLT